MKITTRREEGVTIVDLDGKLIIGAEAMQLRETIKGLLDRMGHKILLNLQKVRLIDSSGIGELMRVKTAADAQGATIKLLHVEDKVRNTLEMTGLIGVFETFNDEIDAIASFRA